LPFLELQPFGVTDAGKVRQNNEDALLIGDGEDETLFVVADGIGGFEAGEVASSLAVEVLKDLRPDRPFKSAIAEANRRILAAGRTDEKLSGMGTTVVAIRFGGTQQEPLAEVAHVGDSRAYLVRGGEMNPITEDHSLVAELVRSGDLTRDQAAEHPQKNLITRALGADEDVAVDTTVLPIEAGDRVLLCSDGLSDMVPETRISELLLDSPEDPEGTAHGLLAAALDAGGNDNITVIVVDVKEQAPPPSQARRRSERRSGTSEMHAVEAPPQPQEVRPPPPREAPRGSQDRARRHHKAARRKRKSGFKRARAGRGSGGAGRGGGGRGPRQGARDPGVSGDRARPGLPLGIQPLLLRLRRRGRGGVPGAALRAPWVGAQPGMAPARGQRGGYQGALQAAHREPQALHRGPGREDPRGLGKLG
jgi:serine/threonine protein phosphatase PrpC